MNGKPDEHLDQWIRQSLDTLPDAPPPGTTFDAERLWTQMRPALQKPVTPRQRSWVWWAAAACLIGLAQSWLRFVQLPEPDRMLTRSAPSSPPVEVSREPATVAAVAGPRHVAVPPRSHPAVLVSRPQSKSIANATMAPAPTKNVAPPLVADAAQSLSAATGDSTTLTVVEHPKQATRVAAHKRRFQVVHLNELRAEDEIRPTPHRTDRFVRLGTSNNEQPMPEATHPAITWPLTTKSNL